MWAPAGSTTFATGSRRPSGKPTLTVCPSCIRSLLRIPSNISASLAKFWASTLTSHIREAKALVGLKYPRGFLWCTIKPKINSTALPVVRCLNNASRFQQRSTIGNRSDSKAREAIHLKTEPKLSLVSRKLLDSPIFNLSSFSRSVKVGKVTRWSRIFQIKSETACKVGKNPQTISPTEEEANPWMSQAALIRKIIWPQSGSVTHTTTHHNTKI